MTSSSQTHAFDESLIIWRVARQWIWSTKSATDLVLEYELYFTICRGTVRILFRVFTFDLHYFVVVWSLVKMFCGSVAPVHSQSTDLCLMNMPSQSMSQCVVNLILTIDQQLLSKSSQISKWVQWISNWRNNYFAYILCLTYFVQKLSEKIQSSTVWSTLLVCVFCCFLLQL